ncbi:uncharacterized protein PHALS_03942 [Plasmopara halstedii]|uniref:Uncharacterized protein n=1 Tax=Plasmopara halstedii TaxID=4781 RepID=A0A0P1B1W5_PLAHL|nr:uncharacterized protein PHALS_03942 [Plasmopara halstedii]CEG47288.1 hypothetical protein PHALS_03942 [Plasmopara halstedii]|eukprot:XP_024583657.1 hypothetical protein PHALS_03942 [Plasmopara halstedii]
MPAIETLNASCSLSTPNIVITASLRLGVHELFDSGHESGLLLEALKQPIKVQRVE